MNKVVEYYENYREEDRLTTNNARRIELLTTVAILDDIIPENARILDCAAGTGAYAFHYAERGHEVTATDITPRHVEIMDKNLEDKSFSMKTAVLDATDMSCFENESFDVVLNMGPFYHLTDKNSREKCFKESLRVLKKGGLLVIAYIPRLYINQMIAMADEKYVDEALLAQIQSTGELHHDDPKCFWTDTYYSSAEEMEKMMLDGGLSIVTHFAQDGLLPMFDDVADNWNEEKFEIWRRYHLSVCRDKSVLGMSNHVVVAGGK